MLEQLAAAAVRARLLVAAPPCALQSRSSRKDTGDRRARLRKCGYSIYKQAQAVWAMFTPAELRPPDQIAGHSNEIWRRYGG